ncbi:MAG: carbon-nitrogen hydrolase family protein [Kiritimatiellaeota bacterium]|nr:carbon-nitrogen hydrolase family protein [Kiritimatiellota bacterium]
MDKINRRNFISALAAGSLAAGCRTPQGASEAAGCSPPPQGRRARIASVCQVGSVRKSIAETLPLMMELCDRALAQKPDLVCLPENFATAALGKASLRERAEAFDGPTLTAAAQRAKQHRCYIVCPVLREEGGKLLNSAVILDRAGAVCGIYNKSHPVTTSPDYTVFEDGVMPVTTDIPVFDLDFGRVGIQICYDMGFPENWELLRKKGAQLVLWPSAYDGGASLWTYSFLHRYYIMSSVRSGQSRLVDPCGAVLAETQPNDGVIVRDINLDYIVSHLDWNRSIPDKIKAKYGDRVDVRRPNLGCSHFIVAPVDPAITVRALQQEFGFESSFQYHQRHREAHTALRAGRQPPPQVALHGNRPEWGKF